MKLYQPQKIFIEQDALDYPFTQSVLKRLPKTPHEIIKDVHSFAHLLDNRPDAIGEGKRYLLLKKDQGRSFKPFPEIENYLACDYYTLHLAEGCDLECSYCILQAYLTNPFLTLYANVEEMLKNLQDVLDTNPDKYFRIGTGQLADSLSMDHITGYSEILIPFFAKQKNALLELKTKSTNIARLLSLDPKGNAVISWSLNSEKIQTEEEHKTASLTDRLTAAQKISETPGYRCGFHFDPIIDYSGWEDDYKKMIDRLFAQIPEEKIAWISLGCLRFMPELKSIMQKRFPKSELPLAEWVMGLDGKMRYFKPRRVEIYQRMVEMIRRQAPSVTIYLSMELPEVWRRVFGEDFSKATVCQMLDRAATSKP